MRVALQPAYILHRRPYHDTSLLLEIFSRDHGRMGVVARGARRSRQRGILQSFVPLWLSWSGRGDLVTLTKAEEVDAPYLLPPDRLLSGLYVNELVLLLSQRCDPNPKLFESYEGVLRDLAGAAGEEPALRVFEKRLLAVLGYGLRLDTEALTNAPIDPDCFYRYAIDQGPIVADQTPAGIPVSGKSLIALGLETLDDPLVLRDAKRLTRAAISLQLQGRPLKTRQFLLGERRRREGAGQHAG
jgi:DNA repair protein RecO (recombination protein O)